jgi:hypothetical protein
MSEPEESTLPRIGVRDRHNSGGYTGANVTPTTHRAWRVALAPSFPAAMALGAHASHHRSPWRVSRRS